jgi:hypothetical protein
MALETLPRMKDPNVIHCVYFSAVCSKNIILCSCQYTKTVDKYWILQLDIVGTECWFINYWHLAVTGTADRRTNFIYTFSVLFVIMPSGKKRDYCASFFVYVGFTIYFLPQVTTILSELQSRIPNDRREVIARTKSFWLLHESTTARRRSV